VEGRGFPFSHQVPLVLLISLEKKKGVVIKPFIPYLNHLHRRREERKKTMVGKMGENQSEKEQRGERKSAR
jgi:hypothetical protein